MSGLVGILSRSPVKESRRTIKRMLASMEHEIWYKSGTHESDELFTSIGWNNHPGEFSDCMPIFNESKDLVLILVGEVFHDLSEIQRLRSEGHFFDENNASYLVHLYEEKGDRFFAQLNGWFSGVLLDYRKKRIVLFNDRFGMQRVFVHEGRDGVYFSSEAKALLAVVPEIREFDPEGLGQFLTCGCTLGDRSLFKDVTILRPGSLWTFEDGKVSKKDSYFNTGEWEAHPLLDEKQFVPVFLDSFADIVARYTIGSLPVGISLTGGLDSRMLVASLDTKSRDFPCFTFGSLYRETFDVEIARKIAKTCGLLHHELVLGEDFLRNFPRYLEKAVYVSDGSIGLSGAAELYANAMVRGFAQVRLTGNCGGELLRGDRAFKCAVPQGEFVTPGLEPYLHEARTTFQRLQADDPLTFALFHQAPSQGYGRLVIERSQVVLRTPFMDNDLVRLVYQAPRHLLKGEALSVAIISRHNPDMLKIPTDRGWLYGDSLLRRLARRGYQEATFKAEYWSSHGMPGWLAAISGERVRRSLEKRFVGRHKFQHFSIWTREPLGGYLEDVILQGVREFSEFFDYGKVEIMLREHMGGRGNYINELDRLLTLILARQTLFKGVSESDFERTCNGFSDSGPENVHGVPASSE